MQRHIARILAKPHKGVNPNAVLLTYRSSTLDPRMCAILRAARSARQAIHTMPIVFKDFSKLVNDPVDPIRTYGPVSVLAAYFNSLGIKPHAGGYLTLQTAGPTPSRACARARTVQARAAGSAVASTGMGGAILLPAQD